MLKHSKYYTVQLILLLLHILSRTTEANVGSLPQSHSPSRSSRASTIEIGSHEISPVIAICSLFFCLCCIVPGMCVYAGYLRYRCLTSRMSHLQIMEMDAANSNNRNRWDTIGLQESIRKFRNVFQFNREKKKIVEILQNHQIVSFLSFIF